MKKTRCRSLALELGAKVDDLCRKLGNGLLEQGSNGVIGLYSAGQADSKRHCGELKRQAPKRMSESSLIQDDR